MPAVFFYDGECGLCDAAVRFLLRHTDAARLQFSALQSSHARRVFHERGLAAPDLRAAWLLKDGTLHAASSAVLEALDLARGWPRLLRVLLVVPRPMRDAGYAVVARWRRRLAPGSCPVRSPEEQARFLA